MAFKAQVGDTIFLEHTDEGRHRWIILTAPNEKGKVVIVNFTDAKNVPGQRTWGNKEWPVLTKESTIFLKDAALADHEKLRVYGTKYAQNVSSVCPLDIVMEIVKCAIDSIDTEGDIKSELQKHHKTKKTD